MYYYINKSAENELPMQASDQNQNHGYLNQEINPNRSIDNKDQDKNTKLQRLTFLNQSHFQLLIIILFIISIGISIGAYFKCAFDNNKTNQNLDTYHKKLSQMNQVDNDSKLTTQFLTNFSQMLLQQNHQLVQRVLKLERLLNESMENITYIEKGYLKLNDSWIAPLNGYKYKLVTKSLNWSNARSYCHSLGGDLAFRGIQNIHTRQILIKNLPPAGRYSYLIWIGLNDISSEGNWRWIGSYPSNNGEIVTDETALWRSREPSSYDCAGLHYTSYLTISGDCSIKTFFLCETSL